MPENIATDLSLISTKELEQELCLRYNDIIIIREIPKDKEEYNIRAKTGKGCFAKPNVEYDPLIILDMLQAAATTLMINHFETDNDDSDELQDTD